eukprot:2907286-Heterocapsa_arctica.AAC.1
MYMYMYIYLYTYTCTYVYTWLLGAGWPWQDAEAAIATLIPLRPCAASNSGVIAKRSTASFHIKNVGFGGFDLNQLLMYMGWIC